MGKRMINNLVIVGNGLDLHHGIRSRYKDFYNSDQMPEHLKRVYDIITCKLDLVDVWYDFEEEYRELIADELQLMIEGYGGKTLGLSPENQKRLLPRVELINYVFQEINRQFLDYLRAEYFVARRNELFVVDSVVQDYLGRADVILNFNYTDTLADLYGIDANRIIHVHGSLSSGAIIGHSNYCDYDPATGESENYGLHMNIPSLRETAYKGDKTLQRIESWNVMTQSSGEFTQEYQMNSSAISSVKVISSKSPISMNMLDYMYEHPFNTFVDSENNISYVNKLALSFGEEIKVAVIGHGIQSDIDLLSKIPTKIDEVVVLQREPDSSMIERAKKTFNPKSADCDCYKWK